MSRLVVVSNRMPLGENPSGGLVVALREQLAADGGLWIGWNGEIVETPSETLTDIPGAPFARKGFDMTQEEYDRYYLGFSNSVLWPLFHGRTDLLDLRPEYVTTYRALNRRIARMIAAELKPDDRLWVHDYHLFPLAHELRSLKVTSKIGHFLHIPFPSIQDCLALPDIDMFASWLAAYDLLGLQSSRDVAALQEAFRMIDGAELMLDGFVRYRDRVVQAGHFPIGIDAVGFARIAAAQGPEPTARQMQNGHLIIGVDRLDYSKGLPQRFRAFGHLLDRRPDLAGKVSLLQIAPPTREEVKAYQDIREELESLSGHINGAHATLDWTPIRYIHRPVKRERLAALYRASLIGLVTPLADGMNLVAKEYVAAQDPDDPGVLILSKFAGAVEQMTEALIVNPHNLEEVAQAIVTALAMPLGERRERHQALMATLTKYDITWWGKEFLATLERTCKVPPQARLRAV